MCQIGPQAMRGMPSNTPVIGWYVPQEIKQTPCNTTPLIHKKIKMTPLPSSSCLCTDLRICILLNRASHCCNIYKLSLVPRAKLSPEYSKVTAMQISTSMVTI